MTEAATLQVGTHQVIARISPLEHSEVAQLLLHRLHCEVKCLGYLAPDSKKVEWAFGTKIAIN